MSPFQMQCYTPPAYSLMDSASGVEIHRQKAKLVRLEKQPREVCYKPGHLPHLALFHISLVIHFLKAHQHVVPDCKRPYHT